MRRSRWAASVARCTASWTSGLCRAAFACQALYQYRGVTMRRCPLTCCPSSTAYRKPRQWSITRLSSCPTKSENWRHSTKRRDRHASIPNPGQPDGRGGHQACAGDSCQGEQDARVQSFHFNLVVGVSADTDIQKCTNYLENAFGRMGIHISKHAYNQLELFVALFSRQLLCPERGTTTVS